MMDCYCGKLPNFRLKETIYISEIAVSVITGRVTMATFREIKSGFLSETALGYVEPLEDTSLIGVDTVERYSHA